MLHILRFPFMIYLNGLLLIRPGKERKVKLGREFFVRSFIVYKSIQLFGLCDHELYWNFHIVGYCIEQTAEFPPCSYSYERNSCTIVSWYMNTPLE